MKSPVNLKRNEFKNYANLIENQCIYFLKGNFKYTNKFSEHDNYKKVENYGEYLDMVNMNKTKISISFLIEYYIITFIIRAMERDI